MEKVKKRFNEMSLKKSLIITFTVIIVIILSLSAITVLIAVNIQRDVLDSRELIIDASNIQQSTEGSLDLKLDDQYEWSPLTANQMILYYGSIAVMIILPIFYVIVGILLAAKFYYRIKLKKPLNVLENGISNITNGNLDFDLDYKCQDELGKLCGAMEIMRMELRQDKKHIWELLESRKALNASIAHDLGTPITVIKGYLEYLQKNIPLDKISEESLMDTLKYMSEATSRLERYIDCVRDIQKLEDIEMHIQDESFIDIYNEFKSNISYLEDKYQKKIELNETCDLLNIKLDKQIFFRIMENIIENAMRYARCIIKIEFSCKKDKLEICIEDDGKGFSEEFLKSAFPQIFITEDKEHHFGLGLNISKVLCEKHGGGLTIRNSKQGGGSVFLTIKI